MKTATITKTKNRLSSLLEIVKAGETILILDRNVPVVRLESVIQAKDSINDLLISQLERNGLLPRKQTELPKQFFRSQRPKPAGNVSIIDGLLKDRDQGR